MLFRFLARVMKVALRPRQPGHTEDEAVIAPRLRQLDYRKGKAAIFMGFGSIIDIYGVQTYRIFRELERSAYAQWESDWSMVGLHLNHAMSVAPEASAGVTEERHRPEHE